MKRIIISILTFTVLMLNAQTDDLPQKVKDAFYGKYPKARDIIWKIGNNNYEIEFYQAGDMFTSIFDKEGNWIETGVVIADGELPLNLQQELNKKYANEMGADGYITKPFTRESLLEEIRRLLVSS